MRTKLLLTLALLLMLSLSIPGFAQDGTAEVIGDANAPALGVVQSFLTSFDSSLLSEDVQYRDTAWSQDYQGRSEVDGIYQRYYNGVFTNVSTQPERYIVSGDGQVVVAEYMVKGTNSGDYGSNSATGTDVNISMVSIFRVQDGVITEVHNYSDQRALHQQLNISSSGYLDPMTMDGNLSGSGMETSMGEATQTSDTAMTPMDEATQTSDTAMTPMDEATTTSDPMLTPMTEVTVTPMDTDTSTDTSSDMNQQPGEEVSLDVVLDDPASYYGRRLTIEDELVDAINQNVFLIQDDDLLAPDPLLVVFSNADTAGVDIFTLANEDRSVRVTGMLRQFYRADFQSEFGNIDFSDSQLDGWEEQPVLVIDNMTIVTE